MNPAILSLNSPLPSTGTNSRANRRLNRYLTVLLSGRPYRPPNHLREACKILRVYVRLAERDRKRNPEIYDPLWHVRQLEKQRFDEELRQAIERVYGSPNHSEPSRQPNLNNPIGDQT